MFRKLKKKYKDLRIRLKILIFYIPLIVIPLLAVTLISNHIFVNAIMDKTKKNIEEESKLIRVRTQSIINDTQTCATMVIRNINTIYRNYVSGDKEQAVSFVVMQNQLLAALNYDVRAFPDIDSIIYVDNNFNVVSSCPVTVDKAELPENVIIKKMQEKGPPTNIWRPMETRDTLIRNSEEPVITYSKKVLNENTGKRIGYLIINVKESTLSSVFDFKTQEEGKTYCLLDTEGVCVSAVDKKLLFQKPFDKLWFTQEDVQENWSQETVYDKEQYLLNVTNIDKVDLFLVCLVKVDTLTRESKVNTRIIMILAIACVLGAFGATALLSKVITNPIIKLTKVAGEVRQGNLQIRCSMNSQDEIGTLASVFNEMIRNTKLLISNIKQEQKKKKEFELALVQAQINPHFLYNTLDLIYVLCQMEDLNGASEVTKSLSDFYRISLSQGKTVITIEEELRNVEDYLKIQKSRYEDVLDYKIDVDPEIKEHSILKLTLQPLVENAIYHGIKPKEGGKITIRGYEDLDTIVLQVVDNGRGIGEEKLKILNQFEKSSESKTSFGLSNVDERIKLYFGRDYGIKIESALGVGTKVEIILPK